MSEQSQDESQVIPIRKLPNWIDTWMGFTATLPTPELYRKWAGVCAIAGALERRCYLPTTAGPMYPNMFILLVGPPGVGKNQSIVPMRNLWAATGKLRIAPTSMSHKGFFDQLADAGSQKMVQDKINGALYYHTLLVATPELGVILPEYDLGYLSMLNELFECPSVFSERIRSSGQEVRIENPHVHFISGTQPKYLSQFLPDAAFGMGFTARIVMVYAGKSIKSSLFRKAAGKENVRAELISDLKRVADIRGIFRTTDAAEAAMEDWHRVESERDAPTHSRLMHYNTRRIMHLLKLSMAMSAARTDELIITEEDFQNALALLLETEGAMPEIFKEMSTGGQGDIMEEAFNHLVGLFMIGGRKPVKEHRLIHFLAQKLPAYQIDSVLKAMERANIIKKEKEGGLNLPDKYATFVYTPLGLNKSEE